MATAMHNLCTEWHTQRNRWERPIHTAAPNIRHQQTYCVLCLASVPFVCSNTGPYIYTKMVSVCASSCTMNIKKKTSFYDMLLVVSWLRQWVESICIGYDNTYARGAHVQTHSKGIKKRLKQMTMNRTRSVCRSKNKKYILALQILFSVSVISCIQFVDEIGWFFVRSKNAEIVRSTRVISKGKKKKN